ncbi:MAG TPA: ATP-dependent DNA helicase [Candidatus Udaeobacter sp.]|nr:ATP-dependent DNA helicase [Candidatus Udaeobacter sp.]
MIELLAPGGVLAREMPAYEDRAEQRAMSAAVARALEDRRALLVEAGTGTGKTLAYLVPALMSGKKVVVSTGTRALQDQIWRNDVPLLRRIVGREFKAVVVKGVANYVCRRRLGELASYEDGDEVRALVEWARHTTTGDRAEVEWLAESAPVWSDVTVTPETRIGPRCPHFETCFATRARRAAESADLVLVNHHLYFADVALKATGARLLPEHDAVVFDEAHQLEDVATEHFAARISSMRFGLLVRDVLGAMSGPLFDGGVVGDVERAAVGLFAVAREALLRAGAEATIEGTRVPLPPGMFASGAAQAAWFRLDTALEEMARMIEERGDAEDEPKASVLGLLARRARSLRDDLASVAEQHHPTRVYWGELRPSGTTLTASPVHVGDLVRRLVLDAGPVPVLTSATLTVADDFAFTRERLGLGEERADELVVPSPFDYARQALLYLPRDLPEPGEDEFGEAAAKRIEELIAITSGRAFVLFTSHRALRDAARRLAKVPYPLLVQGDQPRAALVERFRATSGAVLLGTGSFWEGVDVPGDALSLVVIDKLPFAPHTDPLIAARMRLAAERGADPFVAVQLPQAAIALKQGFGRLIRRRDDRGIVAVLDPRIVTRRYGRTFVASLPAALPRTSVIEQVRRWWTAGEPAVRVPA